ncbi:hypothetical protein ACIRUY_17545 [Streptomyces erythrochromogenes]|uniref:hypothetical protein n=1 Tax=Streptomyces erythrochromogenes TaxID=285574 RepID=UPI00380F2474
MSVDLPAGQGDSREVEREGEEGSRAWYADTAKKAHHGRSQEQGEGEETAPSRQSSDAGCLEGDGKSAGEEEHVQGEGQQHGRGRFLLWEGQVTVR